MHASLIRRTGSATLVTVLLGLVACQPTLEAPRVRGACFHIVQQEDAAPRFNKLPGQYASLEYCAGALEVIRRRGGRGEIEGAYGGQFLFHNRRAIYAAQKYKGQRYVALVRTGDGRLAMPGAIRRQ